MKHIGTRLPVHATEIEEWMRKLNLYSANAKQTYGEVKRAINRFFSRDDKYGFDGIKRENRNGDIPKPFKGAANNAIQWGDVALDTELSIAMETFRLAERQVIPIAGGGSSADERSHKLSLILSWALNYISDFEDQCKLALRYMLTNSPGVALVHILWNKRAIYGPRRITRSEVVQGVQAYLNRQRIEMAQNDPSIDASGEASVEEMIAAVSEDIPSETAIDVIQSITGAEYNLCVQILKALQEDDVVEYPGIIGFDEGPSIKALEFSTDFILPSYCTSFDLCELWCRQEWVNEAQLRDLAASNNWDDEFIERTLEHPGESVSNDLYEEKQLDKEELKNLYHIVYVYTTERAKNGILSRYQTVISAAPEITACGKEMLRGRRGRYPAVFISREQKTENITHSRGLAELASPVIDLAKKLADAGSNNALVGSLPPVLARGTDTKLSIKPLQVISIRPSSEVKFLQPPAYPAQGSAEYKRLKDELNECFGIQTKDSDPTSVQIRRRERMAIIVRFMRQLLTGILSITQSHASDALMAEILGDSRALDPSLRDDVDGAYQVALKVNVDELDRETLIAKIQTMGNALPVLDKRLEANTTPLLRHVIRTLFPTAADEVLAQAPTGMAAEVRDERNNFVQIKSGIRPEMNAEGGWNYEVRLGVWNELLQSNPNVMSDWSQEAQAFAQEWMQSLQHLAQQYGANASLGKTGSQAVMPMR